MNYRGQALRNTVALTVEQWLEVERHDESPVLPGRWSRDEAGREGCVTSPSVGDRPFPNGAVVGMFDGAGFLETGLSQDGGRGVFVGERLGCDRHVRIGFAGESYQEWAIQVVVPWPS